MSRPQKGDAPTAATAEASGFETIATSKGFTMNDSTTTECVRESVDLRRLSAAVADMNNMAQDSLTKIIGLAKLALTAMESPETYRHPEMIAQALSSIWGIAEQANEIINSEAQGVGCVYDDESELRRYTAAREARMTA